MPVEITSKSAVISSADTMNAVTLGANYVMRITDGGLATEVTVNPGGAANVSSGGTISGTVVSGGESLNPGTLKVSNGGVAFDTIVSSQGLMWVYYSGLASGVTVNNGGSMYVYTSGAASDVTILPGGGVHLSCFTDLANVVVSSGGSANCMRLLKTQTINGAMHVSSATLLTNGYIYREQSVTDVEIGGASRGSLSAFFGAEVNSAKLLNNGSLHIQNGATANFTAVSSGGVMYVSNGGAANETAVSGGGKMIVSNGGTVNGGIVSSGGVMYVSDGGAAHGTEVIFGGTMVVSDGGVHRGGLRMAEGASVSIGGTLDFFVAERSPEDDWVVNDLSLISGTPVYAVTVTGDQALGVYRLAQSAANFAGSISIGDGETVYGELTVGGDEIRVGSGKYSLLLNDGDLTLRVRDGAPPAAPVAMADKNDWTSGDVTVTATFADDSILNEYSLNGGTAWQTCLAGVTFSENGSVSFRSTDADDNVSDVTVFEVSNIDKVAPTLTIDGVPDHWVNQDVALTVSAWDGASGVAGVEYSIDHGEWMICGGTVVVAENALVSVRAVDHVGNVADSEVTVNRIDKIAPALPTVIADAVDGHDIGVSWNDAVDEGGSGVKGYLFRYAENTAPEGDGTLVTVNGIVLSGLDFGTYNYQLRTLDNAGNLSDWSELRSVEVTPAAPKDLEGSETGVRWQAIAGAAAYAVEYSTDDFESGLSLTVESSAVDTYGMPTGTYQWRVRDAAYEVWSVGENFDATRTATPQLWQSEADGEFDLFFARNDGTWQDRYFAEHQGTLETWTGTGERIKLLGKNKITDIFAGSADANILALTDDANGDALFVDDIFSASPASVQQARLSQIKEIRAGAGNDVVDLTSQRFAFAGGVTVCGGAGDDVIWAGGGNNRLFGDAGNDRIIGGADDDIIVGGAGNDVMHGGGGSDIFTFGANWGVDTVDQLSSGTVTLWFESDCGTWDEATRTYTCGENSVTVLGSAAVTLEFGASPVLPDGAFAEAVSENIFEDKGKGLLA